MDKKFHNWLYLIMNINSIEMVYNATILGAKHKEARMLKSMSEAGSKSAKKELQSKRLARINEMIDASSKSSNKKTLTKKDYEIIKVGAREHYNTYIKPIPSLAREQAVISFVALFEGFIADFIRLFLNANIDALKSKNSTLNYEDLIESIKKGDTLNRVVENKLNELMYKKKNWIEFLCKYKFLQKSIDVNLNELFLVRNCIVHNNKRISKELYEETKKRQYKIGNSINVTEKDLARYKKAVLETAGVIWRKFCKKYVEH